MKGKYVVEENLCRISNKNIRFIGLSEPNEKYMVFVIVWAKIYRKNHWTDFVQIKSKSCNSDQNGRKHEKIFRQILSINPHFYPQVLVFISQNTR